MFGPKCLGHAHLTVPVEDQRYKVHIKSPIVDKIFEPSCVNSDTCWHQLSTCASTFNLPS